MTKHSAWLLLFGFACAQGQSSLCARIRALTNDPTVASAHWGVSVTTLDGTVLCGVNDAQLFRPASNNKLFTTAAALALLGSDKRFTTSVVGEGDLTDGTLHGNLRLLGGGDANFGATDLPYLPPAQQSKTPPQEPATIADIEDLADKIVAKGVRSIDGDVIGDDTYFAWEPYPIGWEVDDLDSFDGAPVSGLTIHDNAVEIDVTAGGGIHKPEISAAPGVPYYTFNNQLSTSDAGKGCGSRVGMDRPLGSRTITLFGWMPAKASTCKLEMPIGDPAEFAAIALKDALLRRGVAVGGSAVAHHENMREFGSVLREEGGLAATVRQSIADGKPGDFVCVSSPPPFSLSGPTPARTVLATHESRPLGDDLLYTLKVSQNLHAEIMMRNVGIAFACFDHSQSQGLATVRAFLAQAGIAKEDTVLYDGSGLSQHDLVAPRALTQLLLYATQQKWFPTFKSALPIGGVDGTLASRFGPPASTLQGRVLAKTGTLGEARALSGYVTTAGGKTLAFSVMVDTHRPGGTADRVAMDKIVETIALEK